MMKIFIANKELNFLFKDHNNITIFEGEEFFFNDIFPDQIIFNLKIYQFEYPNFDIDILINNKTITEREVTDEEIARMNAKEDAKWESIKQGVQNLYDEAKRLLELTKGEIKS